MFKKKLNTFIALVFIFLNHFALGDVRVDVVPTPNPPESGQNTLSIILKDELDKAIDDAEVQLDVFMPSMGTMPRMEEKGKVVPKGNGSYNATFDLPMGGTWEFSIKVKKGAISSIAHYSLSTGVPGVSNKGVNHSGANSNEASLLEIGPRRLQMIGVRFAKAETIPLRRIIEAVGLVEQDQTHREEVSLRYAGYVVKQFRGRIGDTVRPGDPLFSVYSPDLVTAQSEFLLANKISQGEHSLHQAANEKLKNLGISVKDIEQIRKTNLPIRDVIVRSPIRGTILDIAVREGSSVNAGQLLYLVGDLSKSYLVARVFQQDIKDIKIGQTASITVPGSELEPLKGKVDLIYPQVEQGAGTVNVRLELNESKVALKPGVYMDVSIPVEMGTHLSIPSEAVLYSGRHRYVFIDRGEGRLEPREVSVSIGSQNMVQVFAGLEEGERVAASGTFLLGSEAQLRSALPKWKEDSQKADSRPSTKLTPTPATPSEDRR